MYYINLSNPLDKRIKFENQTKTAQQIGIAKETLSRILSGKQGTSKVIAYCITKTYDSEAEILDYFEYEGE
jgi:plasmid maintenance system antidote protein VapI